MARQQTLFRNLRSIAGVALIGLGVFILLGNLAEGAARLSHLLGVAPEEADKLGLAVTIGLAALSTLQACLFDRHELLRGLCWILISFWPLLLILAGSLFSENGFTDELKGIPEKYKGHVDLGAHRSMRR